MIIMLPISYQRCLIFTNFMLTSVLVISQCSFVERIFDAQHIMAATMSGELEFDAIAVVASTY